MVNALDKDNFWAQAVPANLDQLSKIKRCLIMVPHPDDESLGCAGLIAMLTACGTDVEVILTTDGSMSHPNSTKFPSKKLAELRKGELEEALKLMGVASGSIRYYDSKDGSMPSTGQPGFAELVSKVCADLEVIKPDLILVPYELDPHCDHKATHQLLVSSLAKSTISKPKIWEYPIWLYERAQTDEVPELTHGELISFDISSYLALKEKCIYAHTSQTSRLIDDDPEGFILSKDVIDNFMQGKEYFMERKKLNPESTLSKQYFDDVYKNNEDPWNFETSDYERDKYLATINAIPAGSYKEAFEIGCSIGVLTKMLVEKCDHLVAMEISETALNKARERLADSSNVEFLLGGIPQDFPLGKFDLIVMSEVGYYLSMEDLMLLRKQIWDALTAKGVLILVHWTHFVHDYPLSGDDVHNCFNELEFVHLEEKRTNDYRLDVYRKS